MPSDPEKEGMGQQKGDALRAVPLTAPRTTLNDSEKKCTRSDQRIIALRGGFAAC